MFPPFRFAQFSFSQIVPKFPPSQVYPRPDNTVYVCAGGSKDSLPVPADPAKVLQRPTNFRLYHLYLLVVLVEYSFLKHTYPPQVEQNPDTIEKVLQVAKQVRHSFQLVFQVTRCPGEQVRNPFQVTR